MLSRTGALQPAGCPSKPPEREQLARHCRLAADRSLHEGQRRGITAHRRRPQLVLQERSMVRRLLQRRCLEGGSPLYLLRGTLQRGATFVLRGLEQDGELLQLTPAAGLARSLQPGQSCSFGFAGPVLFNVFQALVVRVEADQLWVTLPEQLFQLSQRLSQRYALPPDSEARVILYHPLLSDLVLEKPLLDVSCEGFCIPFEPERDLLLPGMIIPRVQLVTAGGKTWAQAQVRHISRSPRGTGLICGLQVLGHPAASDKERWATQVLQLAHPRLQLATSSQVPEAWQVLEDSGYLEETTGALAGHLAQGFHSSWRHYARLPQLGRLMLLRGSRQALATVAANLHYPRSWIIHHLGVVQEVRAQDRGAFLRLVQELYSGIFFTLKHLTGMEYYIAYVDAARSWTRKMYGRFLESYAGREDNRFDRLEVYKVTPRAGARQLLANSGLQVQSADRAALAQLAQALAATLPPLELAAFSYNPDEIGLERFSQACAAQGCPRARQIYTARDQRTGELLAALLAESSRDGTNIFSLQDACWIFSLAQRQSSELACLALLHCAMAHYHALGKREFVYFFQPGSGPPVHRQVEAYRYQTDVFRWIARRSVIITYLHYVHELVEGFGG